MPHKASSLGVLSKTFFLLLSVGILAAVVELTRVREYLSEGVERLKAKHRYCASLQYNSLSFMRGKNVNKGREKSHKATYNHRIIIKKIIENFC